MLYVNFRFIVDNNQVTTPINSEMVLLLFNNNLLLVIFKDNDHQELSVSYNPQPGNNLGEHNDDPNNGYLTESMSPQVGHFIIHYINNFVVYRHKLIKFNN